jgi:phosphoserine phosphatase
MPADKEFHISMGQMQNLLELSRLLTVTVDLDALLIRIAEAACNLLGSERASIFIHDIDKNELWTKVALGSVEIRVPCDRGIVGHAFTTNALVHVPDAYADARFNPEPDRQSGFRTRNLITAPMLDLDRKPVGVIQAINKCSGPFTEEDELTIQLLSDQAAVAIQRHRLQQQAVESMALRREMELACQVQQAMIPRKIPTLPGIEAGGWTRPASITGGDAFDIWKTGDGRLGLFLADASGHGIGPALVVSQARTLARALAEIETRPERLLHMINQRLAQDLEASRFVTAFLGFLSADGTMQWCSAGQGPLLWRTSREAGWQEIEAIVPPLGIDHAMEFEAGPPVHFESTGAIFLCSDGIFEANSPDGELFGTERVIELLNQCEPVAPDAVMQRFQQAMLDWQHKSDPIDDQTAICLRRLVEQ